MVREKKDRNNLIMKDFVNGEYQVDIAKKYNISSAMVSKIKKRYLKKVEEAKREDLKGSGALTSKQRSKLTNIKNL